MNQILDELKRLDEEYDTGGLLVEKYGSGVESTQMFVRDCIRSIINSQAKKIVKEVEEYIAMAISIEREECAKICEETWVQPGDLQTDNCHEAADKIRGRNK